MQSVALWAALPSEILRPLGAGELGTPDPARLDARAHQGQSRLWPRSLKPDSRRLRGRDTAKSLDEAVTCGVAIRGMYPACLRVAGRTRQNDGSSLRSPSPATRDARPPMTSSSIPAASSQYLLDLLAQVPDPRKRRGRRHPLAGLLAVGIAAVAAGSRSFAAIGQWAADAGPEALAVLGAARGPAEESTFRRAFARVSADVLDRVLGAWLWTRAVRAGGRLVIAIDGKTVRGARSKNRKAPHLVAALAHGIGAVLGQVAVDEKSNEIPAVRELLKAFADLAGAVFTTGAMHTQHDTAQVIPGRGADYVMTVKASMPTLYRQLKKLPRAAIPAVSAVSTDHGRRARRAIKAVPAPAWTEVDGAAQVAQLRRTDTRNGKKTVEVVYLITSDRDADPATLAARVRGHRETENCLHWVRSPGAGLAVASCCAGVTRVSFSC